jgi:hypothetical protein
VLGFRVRADDRLDPTEQRILPKANEEDKELKGKNILHPE